MLPTRRAFCAALFVLAIAGARADADDADRIATLLAGEPDVSILHRMDGGVVFGVGDRAGRPRGEITVSTWPPPIMFPCVATRSFYIHTENRYLDEPLTERLVHLAETLVARDDGTLGFARRQAEPSHPPWIFLWEALACGAAACLVGVVRRGRLVWELKAPHLLPAIIQTLVLAYWTLYWRGFIELIPSILMQIALAYAIDALVMLTLVGTWKIGFGPFPIILSANLFNWFDPPGTTVLIAAAMSSRALIRYRGRHLLNPSAFGPMPVS